MIKAVLFDFGGVLTQTGKEGYISNVVAEILDLPEASIDLSDLHGDLRRGKSTHDEFFAEINRRYAEANQITKEAFLAKTQAVVLSQSVIDMAAELRAQGIITGILSNVFSINADELRAQGLYDGFDPVLLSCDLGYAKPDPEIYDLAVERLGLAPHEVLFIDDQEKCLAPARALGMHVIRAESPEQIVADTKALIAAV